MLTWFYSKLVQFFHTQLPFTDLIVMVDGNYMPKSALPDHIVESCVRH